MREKQLRLSIDIPGSMHRELKSLSALQEESMRTIIIRALRAELDRLKIYMDLINKNDKK